MASRTQASDWRDLIGQAVTAVWPSLPDGPLWIEAQVAAESNGDPRAESSAGAQGLLQLMPGTAAELGVTNPFDPRENLWGGVSYLRRQFDRLEDVPDELDRLFWAFAAYNAGLGYVFRALYYADQDKALPGADRWWVWDLSWRYLAHRQADHKGKWADYHQVVTYVGRIRTKAGALRREGAMKLRCRSFSADDLVKLPEIPLSECFTRVLGHIRKADEKGLMEIDLGLITLQQRVAERLARKPERPS